VKLHIFKGYITNLFIAEYSRGLLLLDGASPADLEVIEEFCREKLNRPVSDIRLAVVTHMHPDHSGAAPLLRKKYGTKIAAYKNIDQWYAGFTGWMQHILDCLMAQIVAVRQGTRISRVFSKRITKPDFLLDDGDNLPLFHDWGIIYTPGHTTHDIALFHAGKKMLYCGDSIVEVRNRYYLPLPVIYRESMKNSYMSMASLGAETILLPHGNVIEDCGGSGIFDNMINLLDIPPNKIRRRVHWFSVWSPVIWKPVIRRFFFRWSSQSEG
jgi:glyoxylase-like metal-dependent hydrolase (beta-lactamase superfamily II)